MAANGHTQNRYSMGAVERDLPAESKLWRAVILNCWRDAFVRSDSSLENSDRDENGNTQTAEMIRGDARRWLCSKVEPWASDRREICDLAEVSEHHLISAAKAMRDSMADKDVKRSREAERQVQKEIERRLADILARETRGDKYASHLLTVLAEYESAHA